MFELGYVWYAPTWAYKYMHTSTCVGQTGVHAVDLREAVWRVCTTVLPCGCEQAI